MLNGIYILSVALNTFAEQSIIQGQLSNKKISEMRRKMKSGFTNYLPEIVLKGFFVNGKFAKTGTIVMRTLHKEVVSKIFNEFHYGVVLGTDAYGNEWIIEMTDTRNVNILTKWEFIYPYSENHFRIYSIPEKDFVPKDIYKKAERFEYEGYSILNLNCIDFSQYCVYDKEPIRRSDALNDFVLKFNELGQKLTEYYIQTNPSMKQFFEENDANFKRQQKVITATIKPKVS